MKKGKGLSKINSDTDNSIVNTIGKGDLRKVEEGKGGINGDGRR